jgi:Domain of unknown function (DUF4136)
VTGGRLDATFRDFSRSRASSAVGRKLALRTEMTRRLNRLVLVTLLAATTIVVEAAKIKVEKDPTFDFSTLKTWAWNPAGPGSVKVIVSPKSKSEPVQRQYEPVIMQAVEDQLAARGYTKASMPPASFFVTYYVLVTLGSSEQYMGQFLPTNAQWGIPMFAPATQSLTYYPQGTLVIDAAAPAATDMVWRGIAEAKIDLENSDEKRTARLQSVIKDLLAKFPKKKK